jgi:hypothetical protein
VARGKASYFSGGPVANATVQWRVMREVYNFDRWEGQGYYSFSDYEYDDFNPNMPTYGEFLTEGTGQTDASGNFLVRLPLDISDQTQSQTYTIEISVVDVTNQEVTGGSAATFQRAISTSA